MHTNRYLPQSQCPKRDYAASNSDIILNNAYIYAVTKIGESAVDYETFASYLQQLHSNNAENAFLYLREDCEASDIPTLIEAFYIEGCEQRLSGKW